MNYKRQGGQAVQSGQPARAKDGHFVLKATPKEGSLDAHYYRTEVVKFPAQGSIMSEDDKMSSPPQRIELIFLANDYTSREHAFCKLSCG